MAVISPTPLFQMSIPSGLAVGYKIFSYAGGTTTKLATYTDSTGGTPNTNPIILDANGDAKIWLTANTAYKLVAAPPTDTDPPTSPIWTVDQIQSSAGVTTIGFGTTGLLPSAATSGVVTVTGTLAIANGGTNATTASITSFNNITGYSASGATGTTSGNLVFDTSPTIVTPTITGGALNAASTVGDTGTQVAASAGFRGSPVNTQNTNYSTVIADNGKTVYHTSASAHTYTIDDTVSYPIGAIVAMSAENGSGNVTVAINNAATLRWGSSTGSRTLAANGQGQAQKMAAGLWRLTGAGIS